jgi:hypothetical protein
VKLPCSYGLPLPQPSLSTYYPSIMGLFSLKRRTKDKTSSPSSPVAPPSPSTNFASPPTPSSLFRGRLSAPSSPALNSEQGYFSAPPVQSEPEIPSPPKITLNVLIDSVSERYAARLPESARGVFQISVEEDAEVEEVQYEVDRVLRLRGSLGLGCYKVRNYRHDNRHMFSGLY